jgi:hypothetical protein
MTECQGGGVKPSFFKGIRGGFYAFLMTALLGSLFAACSKSSSSPNDGGGGTKKYPEENMLKAYLDATAFDKTEVKTVGFVNALLDPVVQQGYVGIGLVFTPKVTGTINAITLKLPFNSSVNANFKNGISVLLWDVADTKKELKTFVVPNFSGGEEATLKIEPYLLTKGKQYAIATATYIYYNHSYSAGGKNATYPVQEGNIRIDKYIYSDPLLLSGAYKFPDRTINSNYSGDLGFVFQQTE